MTDLGIRAHSLAVHLSVSHTTVYSWLNNTTDVPTWLWPAVERELSLRAGTLAEVAGVHPGVHEPEPPKEGLFSRRIDELEEVVKRLRQDFPDVL
jgi:hypothetical protein